MLNELSNQMADAVAAISPSVVQVQGRRRPVSGLAYADEIVITTASALGRENGLHVRADDGQTFDAELAGWDPTTNVVVLRVPGLHVKPLVAATSTVRVGHLALAIARSWSNAVTASAGIVSVIAGPLRTGRRRAIDQVIRTTAPMHDGFAGGAFIDTSGGLIGLTTAAAIRGLAVVIPASIAWKAAASVLEHGGLRRGYLGVAGQEVMLPESQRPAPSRPGNAVLVINVTADSPASRAAVLVGDVIVALNGQSIESPDDLMDALAHVEIGKEATLSLVRGGAPLDVSVTVGERPAADGR